MIVDNEVITKVTKDGIPAGTLGVVEGLFQKCPFLADKNQIL